MLLNRREFTGLGVALSSFMAPLGASAIDAASGATSSSSERTVRLRDGTVVPVLGQGSARLALGRHPEAVEEEALRTGLSLGMTLIDTSDDYSGGRSEKLIGDVIADQRDRVFLVSKLSPVMQPETAWRTLARRASLVSAPITSISICCTGQVRTLVLLK